MSTQQPRKKQSPPKRQSPVRTSSGRRPLHRRSSSDINIVQGQLPGSGANTPTKQRRSPKKATTSPAVFPKLPSQIFPPHEQLEIRRDRHGAGRPLVLSDRPSNRPPRRQSPPRMPSWQTVNTDDASRTETTSTDMWRPALAPAPLTIVPPAAPAPVLSPRVAPGTLVSYMRQRYEEADAAAKLSQFSFERNRSVKSLPASPHSQAAEYVSLAPSLADDADLHQDEDSPVLQDAQPLRFEKTSSSTPGPHLLPPPPPSPPPHPPPSPPPAVPERSPHRPSASPDQASGGSSEEAREPVGDGGELLPSISNPEAHTEAFLQALIRDESGDNVLQYPIIKKPSTSTVNSNSSSMRRAYPAPLRLRKKRANSHLARVAARQAANGSARRPTTPKAHNLQAQGSNLSIASSFATRPSEVDGDETPPASRHQRDPSNPNALRWSRGWADEIHDTVAELYPNPLHHKSSYYFDSASNSRVSLDEVLAPRDSFYYWFNDSHTRWAKAFYRGGGRLQLDAPPNVTTIDPTSSSLLAASSDYALITPLASRHGSSTSGDSPDSFGFPERIYIPRSRPLPRQWRSIESFPQRRPDSEWESDHSFSGSVPRTGDSSVYADNRGPGRVREDLPLEVEDEGPRRPRRPQQVHLSSDYSEPSDYQDDLVGFPEAHGVSSLPQRSLRSLTPSGDPSAAVHPTQERDGRTHGPSRQSRRSRYTAAHVRRQRQPSVFSWTHFDPTPRPPFLSLDRRHAGALPVWTAPSMDDKPGPFNKLNRQIWLFFLGFFFPLAWMLAAVLPLPPRPCWRSRAGSQASSRSNLAAKENSGQNQGLDLEGAPVGMLGTDLFDAREVWRYRKARWWRITNRFMSVTGLFVIAAVIACAIIGSRS